MTEASTTLRHLRELARARAASLCGLAERGAFARALVAQAVRAFVAAIETTEGAAVLLPPLDGDRYPANTLEPRDVRLAQRIGQTAAGLGSPEVSATTIAALLNSAVLDEAFRCISGSVAVSAAELEALPLPAPHDMEHIERLILSGAPRAKIEAVVGAAYGLATALDEPATAA